MRWWRCLGVGLWLFGALLGARATGAATCLPGTLQDYIDLGGAGCTQGGVSFVDFALEPGQSFATPLDPNAVQVTPGGTATAPSLVLTFSSSAGAGQLLESFFRFSASAPALLGAGVAIGGASASGDGAVTAGLDVCAGGSFASDFPDLCTGSAETLVAFLVADDSALADQRAFGGISSFFDVFLDVAVDGGLAGTASLGTATITLVPEPSTAALLALGLALLSRTRGRRRR